MTGLMAALIGLGTILTALTFVWMLRLRFRDASVADIGWGLSQDRCINVGDRKQYNHASTTKPRP